MLRRDSKRTIAFWVHLRTLLFIFTHHPHYFSPAQIFKYSLPHAIMYIQLSTIQFRICFCILLHRVRDKYLILNSYCCIEWFNPPTHHSVCSDTRVRQDARAGVGKVLHTFAHLAPLCYASCLCKSYHRIYLPPNAEAESAVEVCHFCRLGSIQQSFHKTVNFIQNPNSINH